MELDVVIQILDIRSCYVAITIRACSERSELTQSKIHVDSELL